ncbi:unnamed protein product [Heligmosomoides polygyrus]|uniref:Uncharacterized protein n=1 Tax=Heligmosomoides polygyrus TaxID=6339 RepID=A0A3P8F4X8_HELPZ|nr:unnamed protein product [Heligmosomoides polygyrus]
MSGESTSKQNNICYLNTKNITNIALRHGLVDDRTDDLDLQSLKTLMKDKKEQIAAQSFHEATKPGGDGFILAFITEGGKRYLERYGGRGLVFDDTFNVTQYTFRLATLMVTDDAGNGFPCVFLLSWIPLRISPEVK